MNRLKKFEALNNHAWFKKLFKKLTAKDLAIARGFILKSDGLNSNEYEQAVNRLFLDRPKPKNWDIITELLANSNE